jgi:16S rRNA (guanine966-N2)-methyltransferase
MTRIIAGEFGGRRIAVPPAGTRPTTDRVREALFSKLESANALKDANALDLFAGSGALGLEAMSRGAAAATFVESSPAAARVIQSNIKELGLGPNARVVKERALQYVRRTHDQFNLVFLDPPYDIATADLGAVLDALGEALPPEANLVLEFSRRGPLPGWPATIAPVSSKDYGDTVLHFAHTLPRDGQNS